MFHSPCGPGRPAGGYLTKALNCQKKRFEKKNVTPSMKKFVRQVQAATSIDDEMILEMISFGTLIGHFSGDQLRAAIIAAIGLAKIYNKINPVWGICLIGMAAGGGLTHQELARYDIILEDELPSEDIFHELLIIGASNFSLATRDNMKHTALEFWFAGLRTVVENWRLLLNIAWRKVALSLVRFWENTKHFFGSTTFFKGIEKWRQNR